MDCDAQATFDVGKRAIAITRWRAGLPDLSDNVR